MAENNEYTINIKAIIDANSTTAKTGNTNTKSPSDASKKKLSEDEIFAQNVLAETMKVGSYVGYGSRQISKVATTLGDTEFSKSLHSLSKVVQYGAKVGAVAAGNYAQIIDIMVDAFCDIANSVKAQQQELAARDNAQDVARIQAGLFNIEDTVIKTNGFSGRYQYQGRGGK